MKQLAIVCGLVFSLASSACAQGLVWTLPEDGQWVRYEGVYTQTMKRPESTDGDLTITWRRNLTMKSLGQEEAEYRGQIQNCRWIEIKSETGKTTEGVLDPGPGGVRMYRLLIPESVIRGTVTEPIEGGRVLFASHVPVVTGKRRIGDEPAQDIESGVFQLYPVVSLLRHYREIEEAGQSETVSVPAGEFTATLYKGESIVETPTYQSQNQGEFYRSSEIPFGVVKWTATTVDRSKGSTEPRTEFEHTATIQEEMQAVAFGDGAESDFLAD